MWPGAVVSRNPAGRGKDRASAKTKLLATSWDWSRLARIRGFRYSKWSGQRQSHAAVQASAPAQETKGCKGAQVAQVGQVAKGSRLNRLNGLATSNSNSSGSSGSSGYSGFSYHLGATHRVVATRYRGSGDGRMETTRKSALPRAFLLRTCCHWSNCHGHLGEATE